jgi:hypothetical protein
VGWYWRKLCPRRSKHGIGESSALGGQSVTLKIPATSLAVACFETAFKEQHLCSLQTYEFDTRVGLNAPPTNQILISEFLGYVSKMNGSFTELTVDLASTLIPVGAQIPPRTATNSLVGVPIQL